MKYQKIYEKDWPTLIGHSGLKLYVTQEEYDKLCKIMKKEVKK